MNERKDMGEATRTDVEWEWVPPTRTGRKAVVEMTIKVLVEVDETDDFDDMTEQAKNQLNKRVVEGKGFYPYSARSETIHTRTDVDRMKANIFVPERSMW